VSTELSVVLPVLNEEDNIPEVYGRLSQILPGAAASYEIIFVDDGSTDSTWRLVSDLSAKDPRVKGVSFSRNFGHQMAFAAGLEHATGDAVVIMDADLQDPPELLPELIARWREGYDIVYAVRAGREGETFLKKFTAAAFYRTLRRITQVNVPVDTGDFRLMGRRAVDAFLRMPERHRFTRAMVAWMGFRQIGVHFQRPARFAGETKYHVRRLLRLASDGLVSFSHLPLQIATWLGVVVVVATVLATAVACGLGLAGVWWRNWVPLFSGLFFLGGVQLVTIGLLGSYVGRIYDEVKRRPLYLVQETVGMKQATGSRQ
jgi:glycosyltransferase involved in cell wall biosynthesis